MTIGTTNEGSHVTWRALTRRILVVYLASYLAFTPSAQAATATWNFTTGSDYTLGTNVSASGGVVKLDALDFTDNANDATGFSGGTQSNTQWDAGNSWVELTDPTVSATGDFTSRILDAGASVPWGGTLAWTPQRPAFKELPDSAGAETAYTAGNIDMTGNKLLLHVNDTNWNDGSGNSNTMTGNGSITTTASGKLNGAATFDGTDDYLSRAYDADFDFGTGGFSASGWFKSSGSTATTSVTSRVAVSTDDAEQNLSTGAISVVSSDLELVYDGVDQQVGMRFPSVAVPQGALIDSAKITFTGDSTSSGNMTMTFSGQAVDAAPSFIAKTSEISNRAKTSATVDWVNPAAWALNGTYDTPDLKTVIQEIVNRSGWTSGNPMALFVDSADTAAKRKAFAADTDAAKAPLLTVVYKQPQILLSRYDGDQGFKVWMTSEGKVAFAIDDDATWSPDCQVTSSASTYDDNGWHHFAVVKTANTDLTLYVDGASVATIGTVTSGCTGSVTRKIITSTDDAEQTVSSGAMDLTSSDLDTDSAFESGLRFQNIPIPQGATITSTTIDLKVQTTTSNTTASLTFKSELADNASTFTSTASDISGRSHSTTSVNWSPGAWNTAGATITSPDIKSIIQDVTDRAGWASGNSLVIFVTSNNATNRSVESHDNTDNTLDAASITINYTHPAQGTLTSDSAVLRVGSDTPTAGGYFSGTLDEVALFNRALSATEAADLYKRAALRLKFQVRSCDDNACSGESFIGPDGTNATYYEEQDVNTTGLPSQTLANVSNNRYFQYKTFFETDSTSITPELKSVVFGPTHYNANDPTVVNVTGQAYSSLSGFAQTLGAGNAGTVKYQISSDGTNWKYYSGSWQAASGYAQTNTAAEVNTNIGSFSSGTFYLKAFLHSANGTQAVELDNIDLTYTADVNNAPTAAAGSDQAVNDSVGTVTLNGTGSSDPENNPLTYSWSETADAQTVCSINSTSASQPVITITNKTVSSTCTYSLTVNDGTQNSSADTVDIVITGDDDAPTAAAGSDQAVNDSVGSVNVSSSGSSDPESQSLTCAWSETADAQTMCAISSTTSCTPSVTVTNKAVNNTCTYSLVVNDGTNNSSADTIDIVITGDNDAPTASSVSISGTLTVGQVLTGSHSYSDPEGTAESGTTRRWLRADTSGGTYAAITNATSTTYTLVTADAHKFLKYEVTPSDGLVSGSAALSAAATIANTAPVANAGSDQAVNDSVGSVNLSNSSSTDADSDTLTCTWSETADAQTMCAISSTTSCTPSVTVTNKAVNNTCTYSLVVNDGTSDSAANTIDIVITGDNDAPTASSVSISGTLTVGQVLTGSHSYSDPEGTAESGTTRRWLRADTSGGTYAAITNATSTTYTLVTADAHKFLKYEVTPSDGLVSGSAALSAAATIANTAPIADAGADQAVNDSVGTVSLSGSGTDADNDAIASYTWSETADAQAVCAISSTSVQNPTVTVTNKTASSTCTYSLVVNDGTNNSAANTMDIVITGDNDAPTAAAGADQAVNDSVGSVNVSSSGSSDPESQSLTCSWSETADAQTMCAISSTTSCTPSVTITNKATNNTCTYSLVVNDGTNNSAADTMDIVITGDNDVPSASNVAISGTLTIGQTLTGSHDYSDPEGTAQSGTTRRWLRADTSGGSYSAISGATSTTYVLTTSDAHKFLKYEVTPSDGSVSGSAVLSSAATIANTAPVANAGSDQAVNDSAGSVNLSSSSSSDADGDTLTCAWSETADAQTMCAISSTTSCTPSVTVTNKAVNNTCTYSLVVNDGTADSAADTIDIVITGDNDAPTASAGPDRSINETAGSTTVDGSGSSDPEGASITYSWTETADAASACSLSSTTASGPTVTVADRTASYSCTYSLVVNDGTSDSSADSTVVSVTADNDAPTASAGADQSVNDTAGTATLNGTASSDPEGQSITYAWSETADSTSSCSLSSSTASQPTVTITDRASNYTCTYQLIVNDGTTDSSADSMVLSVAADNGAPTASAGADQAVNDSVGSVNLSSSGSSDPESQSLTCAWSETADAQTMCAISSTTSCTPSVTVTNKTVNNTCTYSLVVNDGTNNSNADTVDIVITGDNDVPSASNVAISGTLSVGQELTGSHDYSDPEGTAQSGTTRRWLRADSSGGSYSAISGATATTYTLTASDAHKFLKYEVTPSDGSVSGSVVLSSAATIANSVPVAAAGSDQAVNDSVGSVNLSSSSSSDADGDTLTCAWSETADAQTMCAISSTTSCTPSVTVTNKTVNNTCTYSLVVNDGTNNSSADTIDIVITGDNDAPSASSVSYSGTMTVGQTLTGSYSYSDPEGTAESGSTFRWLRADSSGGTYSAISGATSSTYVLVAADGHKYIKFEITPSDGSTAGSAVLSSASQVQNTAPTATAQSVSTNEDTAVNITLTGSDADSDTLTFVRCAGNPSKGSLGDLNSSSGAITYTPNANASGSDSFTFKVNDGTAESSCATLSITINAVNDTPTANAQSASTNEDTAMNMTLTGSDVEGSSLTFSTTGCTAPTKGALSGLNSSTGAITYTPNTNATGTDSFTFKVNDGTIDSSCATVSITINAANDAPTLTSIGNKSVAENSALSFTISGSDVDGDTLTYSASNLPSGASFNTSTRAFSWTPSYSQSGTYSNVSFSVSDGTLSASESITITVSNTDRASVLAAIGNKSVAENAALTFTLSATDDDGDIITYSMQNGPSGATLSGANFSWTPSYSQSGSYNVTFTATSGNPALNDLEVITITVTNTNRAPTLTAIGNKSVAENGTLSFTIFGSDPDGQTVGFTAPDLPTGASFNMATNTFSWTPTYNQAGTFSVTFNVSDGSLSASETITITVTNTNRAPTLGTVSNQQVAEGNPLNFSVSAGDVDGDSLTLGSAASQGEVLGTACHALSGATVTQPNTGTFSVAWTPNFNDSGFHCTTLEVSDGSLTATRQVIISVSNTNRAPAFTSLAQQQVTEGVALTFQVAATDGDTDTITYTMTSVATGTLRQLPTSATFNVSTRTFSWTPTLDTAGSYIATFTATDNGTPQLSGTMNVTIVVNESNRAPTISGTSNPVADSNNFVCQIVRSSVVISVTGSDPDSDTLTYSMSGRPDGSSFATGTGSNRVFTWAPTTVGNTTVTLTVTDPGNLSASTSYTIVAVRTLDECTATIDDAEDGDDDSDTGDADEPSEPTGPPLAAACFTDLTDDDTICISTRTVRGEATTALDGRQSSQPTATSLGVTGTSADGLIYHWSQVGSGGCPTVELSENDTTTAAQPTFTAPEVTEGTLVQCHFDLTVENEFGISEESSRATVRVVADSSETNSVSLPYRIYGQVSDGIIIEDPTLVSDADGSLSNIPRGVTLDESSSSDSTTLSIINTNGSITNLQDFSKVERKYSLVLPVGNLRSYDLTIQEANTGANGASEIVIGLPVYNGSRGAIYKLPRDQVDASIATGNTSFDVANDTHISIDRLYGSEAGGLFGSGLTFSDFDDDNVDDILTKRKDTTNNAAYYVGINGGSLLGQTITVSNDTYAFQLGGEGVDFHDLTITSQRDAQESTTLGSQSGAQIGLSIIGSQSLMIDLQNDIQSGGSTTTFGDLYDQLLDDGRAQTATGGGWDGGITLTGSGTTSGTTETTSGGTTTSGTSSGTSTTCPIGYQPPSGYQTACTTQTSPSLASKSISFTKATDDDEDFDPAESTNIATGDINNDGYEDTVVGDATAAGIYVYYGTATTTGARDASTADSVIACPSADDNCGVSVVVGDLSGDGYDDIIIGAPEGDGEFDELPNAGEIYIIYGNASLLTAIDIATYSDMNIVYGSTEGGYFGLEMVIVDADSNGTAELVCNLRTGGSVIISFDVLKTLGRSLRVDQLLLATTAYTDPTRVVMLKFTLTASLDESLGVNNLTFTAAGSGLDDNDIEEVLLFEDVNTNGELDESDRQIGSAQTFSFDDGTIAFENLSETIAAGDAAQWLVVYDFRSSSATGMTIAAQDHTDALIALAMLFGTSILTLLAKRSARLRSTLLSGVAAASLGAGMMSCNFDHESTPLTEDATYTYQLTIAKTSDVSVVGSASGESADVLGAPMEGSEVTVTYSSGRPGETGFSGSGGGCGGMFDRLEK